LNIDHGTTIGVQSALLNAETGRDGYGGVIVTALAEAIARYTEAQPGPGSYATAAYRVGYESASQFSREYARMFGAPPRHDRASAKMPLIR
jgi:AraC-like DNA-binding protein